MVPTYGGIFIMYNYEISMLYPWSQHNIVQQLYSHKKRSKNRKVKNKKYN